MVFFLLGHRQPLYHALWHLFVMVGSTLHFVAVWIALFHAEESRCEPQSLPQSLPRSSLSSSHARGGGMNGVCAIE